MPETESYGENVSEYVKKLLDVMDYGIPYTANAIMEKLQIKSKETFRTSFQRRKAGYEKLHAHYE